MEKNEVGLKQRINNSHESIQNYDIAEKKLISYYMVCVVT